MQENSGVHNLENWQVATLRLTAFPTTPPPVGQQDWWRDLVGEAPESQVLKAKAGEQREEGRFIGGKLTLSLQPGRVDWLLQPWVEEVMPGFDVTGPISKVLPLFQDLVRGWLEGRDIPPVQRLAFGAILLQPVETREEGYRVLAPYLPSISFPSGEISDFLYQINRPRASHCAPGALRLNRLTKWSVVAMQLLHISAMPLGRSAIPATTQYAAGLELDINTAADFTGTFEPQQLAPLFDEVVGLGIEIAREGDSP